MTVATGFDVETPSAEKLYLGGFEGEFIRLGGAINSAGETGLTTDARKLVQTLLESDHIYGVKIMRFDIPALARHVPGVDIDALFERAWDLSILERLIDPPGAKGEMPEGYYGLDAMAKRYGHTGKSDDLQALALKWGPQIEREGRKVFTVDRGVRTSGAMSKAERTDLGYERIPQDDPEYRKYLEGDLAATAFVRREVFKRVPDWNYARREMKVAALQNRMTFNGWRVNRVTLANRVRQEDERRQAAVEILCDDYGVPRTKKDGSPSASPWATEGGRAALEEAFHAAGAKYLPRTGTGALAIGKLAMGSGYWVNDDKERVPGMLHPDAYGTVPAVVELCGILAEATGATAKYAEISRYVTADGRVHGQVGEDQGSGRWAYRRPSYTNLGKHGEGIRQRDPFIPEPGFVHLACDLSQVDMRGVAALSQDAAYMALFAPGRDAHMDMAEVYFGVRTKDARNRTKGINHGLNYGQSSHAVSAGKGIPLEVVQAAVRERERAFPRLIEWTKEVRAAGASGRLLDNGFGRLMRCNPDRSYTQAPALMGQGCARDIMCEALLRLAGRWPEVTAYLRVVVHDEVVLSVPEREAELWRSRLAEAFTFEWRGVPILCEVSQPGMTWAECYIGE